MSIFQKSSTNGRLAGGALALAPGRHPAQDEDAEDSEDDEVICAESFDDRMAMGEEYEEVLEAPVVAPVEASLAASFFIAETLHPLR
eukprot:s106_g22.t1